MKEKKWLNCDNRKRISCPNNDTDIMKSMTEIVQRLIGGVIETNIEL
jgi:hypothetical protein